jgi:excisionase family DNA binding protein
MDRDLDRRTPNDQSPLLTPREAAAYIRVGERHLWTVTDRGDLPCIRIGRLVRYHRHDLDTYIDCRRSNPGRHS